MNILSSVTIRNLKKNRTRTIVTIIGIMLSVAMFTAVTTSISSLQNYIINVVKVTSGDWHGCVNSVDNKNANSIESKSEVEKYVELENIGYAKVKNNNESKPYIFVAGVSKDFSKTVPYTITSGRMAKNSNEIVIPKHLITNGGVKYKIGETLTLKLGERKLSGETLHQTNPFQNNEEYGYESFSATDTKTYKIVGICARPNFEDYSAPGYTALTVSDNNPSAKKDIYVQLNNISDTDDFFHDNCSKFSYTLNNDLLMFSGYSGNDSFNNVLFAFAGILIFLIMLGSISLIYNAFSISVSERTKQFGLLKSIGATKRQIMHSVMFEAICLCIIGIPLGVLVGIGGIGVTLFATKGLFASMMITNVAVDMSLSVSWVAIAVAVAVGIITVLISAFIPARRAIKITPIDAIRQSNEIKIKAKKVKTSKLTQKLFGFEGMLASKNFKRNRKKYRATVISLFLSIVLFITASSFCYYLTSASGALVDTADFDITYTLDQNSVSKADVKKVENALSSANSVKQVGYQKYFEATPSVSASLISKDYQDYYNTIGNEKKDGKYELNCSYLFIKDDVYRNFLKKQGLDEDKYMSVTNPCATAFDLIKSYSSDDERYHTFNVFSKDSFNESYNYIPQLIYDDYWYDSFDSKTNEYIYIKSESEESKEPLQEKRIKATEFNTKTTLNVGKVVDDFPFTAAQYKGTNALFMYPYSAIEAVTNQNNSKYNPFYEFNKNDYLEYYIISSNPNKTYDDITKSFDEIGISTENLYNYASNLAATRAVVSLVTIFSYGFIILISLISIANVFNTISTNINLRRREFAMLKSVGMTKRGFNKMMNYECLLYGIKALLYGLPVSILLTYGIFRLIDKGWQSSFVLPTSSIIIAIASVFIVVFSTMIYSMSKVKKDNPIETLKNENI